MSIPSEIMVLETAIHQHQSLYESMCQAYTEVSAAVINCDPCLLPAMPWSQCHLTPRQGATLLLLKSMLCPRNNWMSEIHMPLI
ncbi:hypothetical protein PR048_018954 [Dryococelus australis]|uniref:Uncharacterized protein n=1 Tax=Dryococelus australis TaxID=614101 RepID=A0ABQ9H295_9NEOP|nr:hypothetical protein PR048_018954 [Dryococelus australis]